MEVEHQDKEILEDHQLDHHHNLEIMEVEAEHLQQEEMHHPLDHLLMEE